MRIPAVFFLSNDASKPSMLATRVITAISALVSVAAISLVAGPVYGQQSAAECAEIENDRERLECFDQFYGGAVESNPGASDTSADTDARPATTETERAQREARQARREAEQARMEAAQARLEADQLRRELEQGRREIEEVSRESDRRSEPAADRGTPEERFGMEKKVLELGGDEMSSTALGEFRLWNKGQRIELENGQVWEITNDTNLFHRATNPSVTIEKGLFSAFYLHIDGVSKSLKVRRIR